MVFSHAVLVSSLIAFASIGKAAAGDWGAVRQLRPGRAVQVSYAKEFVAGTLSSVMDDRMVITTKTGEVTAARVDVKRVWVKAQRRGRNAAIGAAIGAAVALLPGLFVRAWANNETGGGDQALAAFVAIGGGIGGGLGALTPGRDLIYKRK